MFVTRQAIIQKTVQAINRLPADKAEEISDYADYVLKKHEEHLITENITKIVSGSPAFSFLEEEEELYSVKDLKERFDAQR